MKMIYYDAFRNEEAEKTLGIEFKSKEEVIRESDYLSVHVPLLPGDEEQHRGEGARDDEEDGVPDQHGQGRGGRREGAHRGA